MVDWLMLVVWRFGWLVGTAELGKVTFLAFFIDGAFVE